MKKLEKFVPDPRYWTDWQLAHRLGCTPNTMHRKIAKLDGFPKKDPEFGWDSIAIEIYFNRRSGLTLGNNVANKDEHQQWDDLLNGSHQHTIRQGVHS
jgi:hypothetical protein